MPIAFGIARTIGRTFIPSLVKRGLGGNVIQRYLMSKGLGYRRIDMLKDVREITGLMKMEKYVKAFSGSEKFSKFGMVEHELSKDRRYRVFGRITSTSRDTGEVITQSISFYDDELRSKDNWVKAFQDEFIWEKCRPDREISKIEITSVEHQQGWSY